MNTRLNERKSTKREALFALLATFGLLAGFAFSADAQEGAKPKDKDEKAAAARESIVEAGYTRPGNVDDKFIKDGEILPAAFNGADVKKFKIMGGTVYFAVFKNTGMVEGDTFGTGMANIDAKFRTGRSFKDSYSPRYDTKAKYLYLYQIVNDRGLDPKMNAVKGKDDKGDKGIEFSVFSPKAKVPMTEDIASFALKLLIDPRYITSWGHFNGAGFVANVADVDLNGKIVKNVVAGGKDKVEDIRLAFSYLPAIVSKIPDPTYSPRARSFPLGELETGFGVDRSTLNLEKSKAFAELKQVVGNAGGDNISWVSFAKNLLLNAEQGALEPKFVQLVYMSKEEQAATPVVADEANDDLTRAIFRVDFDRTKNIKQGDRSVVFGFTTDLPPTEAPIRIDSPKGTTLSEGMKLASYFSDEGTGRAPGTDGPIGLVAAGADGAALALAMGTALGQASTPAPAPAAPAAGFAGITGSVGVGGSPSVGGGGAGIPAVNGAYSRPGGGIGGGGGIGSTGGQTGTGTSQGVAQATTPTQSGSQTQTITFSNTQTNQQAQAQAQAQLQLQLQQQEQNQHGHDHNHHGHGHVVPAPASLLLGLLGLPGLYFLRRRKTEA